jgi:hypothetical protein
MIPSGIDWSAREPEIPHSLTNHSSPSKIIQEKSTLSFFPVCINKSLTLIVVGNIKKG